jgi:cytochrome c553
LRTKLDYFKFARRDKKWYLIRYKITTLKKSIGLPSIFPANPKNLAFELTIDTLKGSATKNTLLADQGCVLYQQGDKARGIVTCQNCLGKSGEGDNQQSIPQTVGTTLAAYKTRK